MRGAGEAYRVGDLVVDVASASVRRSGERLVLPPRTFDLLVVFVRRHPDVVRREDLLETVWADEHVTDQALSHRVMVLRRALGDRAEEPRYVAGERGWGYRMAAPVERLEADRATSPGGGASRPLRRRLGPIAVAVAVVVGVVTLGSRARRPPALPQAATFSARPGAASAARRSRRTSGCGPASSGARPSAPPTCSRPRWRAGCPSRSSSRAPALLRPLSGRPAYRSLLERLPARAGDGSWTKSR